MTTHAKTLLSYQTPAIRHLAWLCQAPQLLVSPMSFQPAQALPADYQDQLLRWDRHPETRPARLAEPAERRLGHYFERLYQVMLTDLLGWDILLKNQQIRAGGQTLGELDFLVRNTGTGALEHHEIAIKYYLGVPEPGPSTLWYGPNARDRLDLKVGRMLAHQSGMAQRPETQALLSDLGLSEVITPKIFMPGYLFYPDSGNVSVPEFVAGDHLRGHWRYASELEAQDVSNWVPLKKPHWIGPWRQIEAPDPVAAQEGVRFVIDSGIPVLFAKLVWDSGLECWLEKTRCFVMPKILSPDGSIIWREPVRRG